MDLSVAAVVFGIVLPAVWSVLCWAGWAVLIRSTPRPANVLAAAAVGGAYAWAFWWNEHPGAFPPIDAVHWLFYGTIAVLLIASAEAVLRPARWWGKLPFWSLTFAVVFLLCTPLLRHLRGESPDSIPLTLRESLEVFAAATAGGLVVRAGLGKQGCAAPVSAVWIMGLLSAISAATVGLSGSSIAPLRAASVGLALLPLLALLLTLRKPSAGGELPAPAISVFVALWGGTLLCCYLYDALTLTSLLLLAGSPLGALVVPGRKRGFSWGLVRVSAGLAAALVALTLAAIRFAEASRGSGGYG